MTIRAPRAVRAAGAAFTSARQRGGTWAESQQPHTLRGTALDAWRLYRAIDGPFQSALLSLYILVGVVPAVLVIGDYFAADPREVTRHLAHQYVLSSETSATLRGVLVQTKQHDLGATLVASVSAALFGIGFGHVLQVVHARAWGLRLRSSLSDQLRYAVVIVALVGLVLLLFVQLRALPHAPVWAAPELLAGWLAVLVAFFIYTARLLTHALVPRRDLAPGAVLSAAGVTLLMVGGRHAFVWWIDFYAQDYGAFGVVMAVFFLIAFGSTTVVAGATVSPLLARRRALRRTLE